MDFYRVSGAGNDFLALVEPPEAPDSSQVRAWCTRGLSLGADGLFALYRAGDGVRMDYWNSDGHPADLCLNGTRCAARLAFELGWAREETSIVTGAGRLLARPAGPGRITIELPPFPAPLREVTLELDGEMLEGIFALAGVPHFVLEVSQPLGQVDVARLGPRLRHHPVFGSPGANIDWVHTVDPHLFHIRSFERGVEAETLACGTGVLAAAAAGVLTRSARLPVTALTAGGFELTVDGLGKATPLPDRWLLTGDARILAHGTLTAEAAELPTPPCW
ncbi:MAG: diaminopimelate epimerase [Thermoanaerobaculia bacterium]